jgi:hypothetical protein
VNEEAMAHWGLLRQNKKGYISKMALFFFLRSKQKERLILMLDKPVQLLN